jgi:hypothetical protein
MMRYFFLVLPLALVPAGCALPGASTTTGWQFTVGKPSTVQSSALVQQLQGGVGVASVAALPLGGSAGAPITRATMPMAMLGDCGPSSPTPPSGSAFAALNTGNPCTLDDLCRRLDRLDQKLTTALTAKEPLPMPRGQ